MQGESELHVLGFTALLVKDLVTTKFGKAKWVEILNKANLKDEFLTHNKYPLDAFYTIAGACCEVLKMTLGDFLEVGGYWFYFYARDRGTYVFCCVVCLFVGLFLSVILHIIVQ